MLLPDYETLLLTQQGGRLDVVLNRPERRNAINAKMSAEFTDLVERLGNSDDIRLVVLRGAGGHFCAGGDIKERRALSVETPDESSDRVQAQNEKAGRAFLAFQNLPQTTITAVEGSAFGGGLGYACLSDITIVTRSARMGMPEVTLGVVPAQIAPFVVSRIGISRARQLALTATRFGGQEAYDYGIAHYLCDDDKLDEQIKEVANKVMACAPMASAATKALLLGVGSMNQEDMAHHAAKVFVSQSRGPEGREGQTAFIEKRTPSWSVLTDEDV